MTDPAQPIVLLSVPAPEGTATAVSAIKATIRQSDGSEFPAAVEQATVHIDWATGEPVTVDLKLVGGVAVEAAAGISTLEINGKRYELREVKETDERERSVAVEPDQWPPSLAQRIVLDDNRLRELIVKRLAIGNVLCYTSLEACAIMLEAMATQSLFPCSCRRLASLLRETRLGVQTKERPGEVNDGQ
jgi:hypothetical protein